MEQITPTLRRAKGQLATRAVSDGRRFRFGGKCRWNALGLLCRLFTTPLLLLTALNAGLDFDASAAEEPIEYRVKAAYILNFTRFIEWPPSAFADSDSPMAICIMGEDPFGNVIDQIVAGEVVAGRKVMVRRIGTPPAPKACQVLYTRRRDTLDPEGVRPGKELPGNPPAPGVLTVGEGNAFVREGGMIGFILETRRVRFDINQAAAENAGLKLSARLLSVARTVEK